MEWINEDELPTGYPYDEMFPFSKLGADGKGGVRIFPKYIQAKVSVRKAFSGKWAVLLKVGVQSFWMADCNAWDQARFLAKMLKIALANAGARVNSYRGKAN